MHAMQHHVSYVQPYHLKVNASLWGLALASACSDAILLCARCQCCAVQVSIKKLDVIY